MWNPVYFLCSCSVVISPDWAIMHAVVGLELKYRAPKAHTMLEVVYVRWGRAAHITFFFFAVLTNLLVSLSMLQGALTP